MYESFYGLREKPFNLLPDPDYLFMSRGHEDVYTHLEYAIAENKGFVVVTGEVGSGKTTLINYLLERMDDEIQVGLITNTYVRPTQLIKMICKEFELEVEGMDKAEMIDLFQGFLVRQFAENIRVLLIIDEAQNLMPETMEEIRMISNLETEKHHLIQMVLVGQPELKYKLRREDLRQFAQRVTVNCHLEGLTREEVDTYIKHRLKVAGAEDLDIFGAKSSDIFDAGAVAAIAGYSHGIPRLINILCDTALVYGYADELRVIDKKVIDHVIKAREAGGIFTEPGHGEERTHPSHGLDAPVSEPAENRFVMMERRLDQFETRVANIEERLNNLAKKRDDRDTVVIELFKMLKDNIENRFITLKRFGQLTLPKKASAGESSALPIGKRKKA